MGKVSFARARRWGMKSMVCYYEDIGVEVGGFLRRHRVNFLAGNPGYGRISFESS